MWCFVRNVFTVYEIDIALMDDYMEYLNAYRKPKDKPKDKPICKANKYALLLNVKTFMGKMHNRGVIENNPVANIELPSVGRPLPKAIFTAEEVEKILEQPLLFGEKGLVDRVILETFFATGIRRVATN
jgi:integrase/recombinase XerD